jgi:hypothetical protein
MANLKIEDKSGDRDFFTIVPNFVINHSTAIDRALYIEMKRFAGESGRCFATEKTMMKRLGIGKKAYNKALEYNLKRGWISFLGLTGGTTRPIKTYAVNDIWQQNSEYYKKISAERDISPKIDKISSQNDVDKFQKQHKISAESNVEEDLILRRTTKEETLPDWLDKKTWSSWIEYRKQKKQKLTPLSISMQIKELAKNIPLHKEIIEQSIRNGWSGLFPLKQANRSNVLKVEQGKYENIR